MADLTTREIEAALFRRMAAGDEMAKYELFERQQPMVEQFARKYSKYGSVFQEEVRYLANTQWLEKALEGYRWQDSIEAGASDETRQANANDKFGRGKTGITTFADRARDYVRGFTFRLTEKYDRLTVLPEDANGDMPVDAPSGRMDGAQVIDSDGGMFEGLTEGDLPKFLNETTTRVAQLLAKGHSIDEVRAMTGLSAAEFEHKRHLIGMKMGLAEPKVQVDPDAKAAFESKLRESDRDSC